MSALSRFLSLRRGNASNGSPADPASTVTSHASFTGSSSGASAPVNAYTTLHPSSHKSFLDRTINDIKELVQKEIPIVLDPKTVGAILDVIEHKDAINDRKFALEKILMIMANLPEDAPWAKRLENSVVMLLYNDLYHPPATFVGPQYAFRTADGSYNNVMLPELGKSNFPYSRSVQQVHPLPNHLLPDPDLLFDCLLKRDKFEPHPAGLSSLMFAFAALVIHTCFRTDHENEHINQTSSYVDLSPLYGTDKQSQATVRAFDGYGNLKPDTFAENRLLLLPPAVCAILVLFNRNHNYIARHLLEINERGTWQDPRKLAPGTDEFNKQEEEIFQTARLINCLWFAQAVFADYLAAILGFFRLGIRWSLNPFEEIRSPQPGAYRKPEPRGMGNAVSAEFNCLYRWHATTSQEDEEWVTVVWRKFFGGIDPKEVTPKKFKEIAKKAQSLEKKAEEWTFGDLTRDPETHRFSNADLASVIQRATSHHAGAFGARRTPEVMRLNEVMGIQQSRAWGVCSLNDFRRYLGLKPYENFLEWNNDQAIADAASKLYYGEIENLELYVGLQAEATKPVIDGAGLCPGYTISRAILADAIALTRGDRFFTTDLTPANYTAWGLHDASRDVGNPGFGSMLARLFLRTLPGEYGSDSGYVWFGLMQPGRMRTYCEKMGLSEKFDWDMPGTPKEGKDAEEAETKRPKKTHVIREYHLVKGVLEDPVFESAYKAREKKVVAGDGFISDPASLESARPVLDALFRHRSTSVAASTTAAAATSNGPASTTRTTKPTDDATSPISPTSAASTTAPSASLTTRVHDLVRDEIASDSYVISESDGEGGVKRSLQCVDVSAVMKRAVGKWVGEDLLGLHLKPDSASPSNPHKSGDWTPATLFDALLSIYGVVFMEPDPTKEMVRRDEARKNVESVVKAIRGKVRALVASGGSAGGSAGGSKRFSVMNLFSSSASSPNLSHKHQPLLAHLSSLHHNGQLPPTDSLVNMLLSVAVIAAAELAQEFVVGVDAVLSHANGTGEKEVNGGVSGLFGDAAVGEEEKMRGVVAEIWRLEPVNSGLYRTATQSKRVGEVDIQRGERVYLDVGVRGAGGDSKTFPDPNKLNPSRSADVYLVTDGALRILGRDLVYSLTDAALCAVFEHKNMRRTPGPSGVLKRFLWTLDGVFERSENEADQEAGLPCEYRYLDQNMDPIPWATSLLLQYDS